MIDIFDKPTPGNEYRIRFICKNCKKITILPIPKGKTVKEFIKEKVGECGFCGCMELETVDKRLMS